MTNERAIQILENLISIDGDIIIGSEDMEALEMAIRSLQQEQQEEPDKSLEEAAEISFDEAYALTEDYRDFLAKGLVENKPRPISPHWFCEYAKKRFIAGAEWQKQQMLKDAEQCELYWDGDFLAIDLNIATLGYSERDKVKVIVLKAEEE